MRRSKKAHDQRRDEFLLSQGFTVMRFDNGQVIDGPDYVFTEIERQVRHLLKGCPEESVPF